MISICVDMYKIRSVVIYMLVVRTEAHENLEFSSNIFIHVNSVILLFIDVIYFEIRGES